MLRVLCAGGALVLATACDPAAVEMAFDDDGDGLLSTEESELGTDPHEADTDGDGTDDGAEIDEGTDPLDADNFPYIGGWEIHRCAAEPASTGTSAGDVVADFSLLDQHGQELKLYDFCEYAVMVVVGAFW